MVGWMGGGKKSGIESRVVGGMDFAVSEAIILFLCTFDLISTTMHSKGGNLGFAVPIRNYHNVPTYI